MSADSRDEVVRAALERLAQIRKGSDVGELAAAAARLATTVSRCKHCGADLKEGKCAVGCEQRG